MKLMNAVVLALAGCVAVIGSAIAEDLDISESKFGCMLDMHAVRGFYVDNLIEGKLQDYRDTE